METNLLALTKKQRLEQRMVVNGQFKFCGRAFNCPMITESQAILIAFDSFRDTEVEVFDATGHGLGLAHWVGLEVSYE